MKTGISTASLYGKMYTEDALDFFNKNGIVNCEVFLSSYSEYEEGFGKILKEKQGNVNVHSIHTLNSQFEGQLFSKSLRQYEDAKKIFTSCIKIGQRLGAKIYVLHGPQQMKYTKYVTNYQFFGERTSELAQIAKKHDMLLTWENVHWTHYNHPDFMKNLRPFLKEEIGCTLDIKQAKQSDTPVDKYIIDMQGKIKNVHIVDFDETGNMVLPTFGYYDYKSLFNKLNNIDIPVMIEVYDGCFKHPDELLQSYHKFKELYE